MRMNVNNHKGGDETRENTVGRRQFENETIEQNMKKETIRLNRRKEESVVDDMYDANE